MAAKSKSSNKWLTEHFSDQYVKKSQKQGFYARSAYKLLEIDDKYKLLKPGIRVVDLGAAPGGWSQVVVKKAKNSKIFALDILPVKPVAGVKVLMGDFTEQETLDDLVILLKNEPLDLILSDMAPNFSGHKAVDIPRSMYLVELAVDFARLMLSQGGALVVKVFQGEGFSELLQSLRQEFKRVSVYKPPASRSRSKELYLVCQDKAEKPLYNSN